MSIFTFGKHKNRSVDEVANSDFGYLRWVLDSHATWNRPPPASLLNAIRAKVGTGPSGVVPDDGRPGVVTCPATSTGSPGTVSLLLGTIAPRPTPASASSSSIPFAAAVGSTADETVNFGKLKGQPLAVLIADRPYATWCLGQDFFKRNKHYSKVAKALGVEEKSEVVSIYSSGSSGIHVAGDNNTCTFGKYRDLPLAKMLEDVVYCAWMVGAAATWDRKPRHFDQIVEAAKKAKPKSSGRDDDYWEPPEDDYELDDAPFEPPEDDGEIDDTPLNDPDDEVGEINDAPLEEPDDE